MRRPISQRPLADAECTPLDDRRIPSPGPRARLYITLFYLKRFSSYSTPASDIHESPPDSPGQRITVATESVRPPVKYTTLQPAKMVYSSDFYTSRRPAYYKPASSYSVTVSAVLFRLLSLFTRIG